MDGNTQQKNTMPSEVLVLILQKLFFIGHHCNLYVCSLVNKQFHSIANPLLWASPLLYNESSYQRLLVSLEYTHARLPRQQQHLQLSPGRLIHRLDVRFDQFNNTHLTRLLPYMPNLQSLTLPFKTQITGTSLQLLPCHCHHITALELHSITLNAAFFIGLGFYCHQLRRMNLRGCIMTAPSILQPLADHDCPLEDLTLFGCTMNTETQAADLTRLAHLTRLELVGVPPAMMKSILRRASTALLRRQPLPVTYPWPQLKKIFFVACQDVNDTLWLRFVRSHPSLVDLSLRDGSEQLTDASMIPMAKSLPGLVRIRWIGMPSITTQGIRQLIQHSSLTLQAVQCNNCPRINATHFKEFFYPPAVGLVNDLVHLDATAIEVIRWVMIHTRNKPKQ